MKEYEKHIRREVGANKTHRAWCGADIAKDFYFQGIDHAIENEINGGRLISCPACIRAVVRQSASLKLAAHCLDEITTHD